MNRSYTRIEGGLLQEGGKYYLRKISLRRFEPLFPDHPLVGQDCPACGMPMEAGEHTTLIPIGPGEDIDNQTRCRHGIPFTAVAIAVHWECATGRKV